MAKITNELITFIKKHEGGFANLKYDKGGATNSGITLSTFQAVYGKNKTVNDLKHMTNEQWLNIFTKLFWNRMRGNDIKSQSVANEIVDFLWGSGKYALTNTQKVLGIKQDGIFGNVTINTINSCNPKTLFENIKKERINYYYRIVKNNPTQNRFLKGWINRANDMKFND